MSETTGATTVPVSAVGDETEATQHMTAAQVAMIPTAATAPIFGLGGALSGPVLTASHAIAPLAPAPLPLAVRLQNAGIPVAAVPSTTAMTNVASSVAHNFPEVVAGLEQVNPAVAAQLTGSLATYAKSGAAPVVGMIVGAAVAHYGLACAPGATTACWSPEFVQQVTLALIGLGTSAGALIMHWISKFPARKVLAASPAVPAVVVPPAAGV